MKRFIFFFITGGLLAAVGQIVLVLGLHPAQFHSLALVLQGGAGLILGTAFAVSGLRGLADGHETSTARLRQLFGTKEVPDDMEIEVQTDADMVRQDRLFWRAYRDSAIALSLFMIGIQGLAIVLTGSDFLFYQIGLGLGLAIFGFPAMVLSTRAMGHLRRTYRTLEESTQVFDQQPEMVLEKPLPLSRRPAAQWNRRRKRPYSRSLAPKERQRLSVAHY